MSTVTTLATITTAATFAITIFLVVFVVVVAIVPVARQPSVVVHIEQAPRYPFSGSEGKGDRPAKFAANAFTNVLGTLALIGSPAKEKPHEHEA